MGLSLLSIFFVAMLFYFGFCAVDNSRYVYFLTRRVEEEPLLVRTKRSGSKRSAMIEQTEIVGR